MNIDWSVLWHTQMLYVYCWFGGGIIGFYALLLLVSSRWRATADTSIESQAYFRTVVLGVIHLATGVLMGALHYYEWWTRQPLDASFLACWKMMIVYAVCLLFDFLWLYSYFVPRSNDYKGAVA